MSITAIFAAYAAHHSVCFGLMWGLNNLVRRECVL